MLVALVRVASNFTVQLIFKCENVFVKRMNNPLRARVEIIVYDNFILVDLHKSPTNNRIYIMRMRSCVRAGPRTHRLLSKISRREEHNSMN